MTREQIAFLEASIDQIVEVEMHSGDRFWGMPLFVYTGEESPDVFLLPVRRGADGVLVTAKVGQSVLLEDIASVRHLEDQAQP